MGIENTLREHGILDVIHTLASNGESGRLHIETGTTSGDFFFRNGQLVDARVGNLTGFQAINAAASMPDGSFTFDPSVVPPAVSSIRPNERVVLKQFFGIDTAAPAEIHHAVAADVFDDGFAPVPVVPLAEAPVLEEEPLIAREDEATLITSSIARDEVADELPIAAPYVPTSRSIYRGGLVLALLFILIAASAVVLRYRFRERVSAATESVATTAAPAAPAESTTQPVVAPAQPVQPPVPIAKRVEPEKPKKEAPAVAADLPSSTGQDLTGKWTVVNTVSKTAFASYKNIEIGFNLSIKQSGKTITGRGQKISENGRSLPAGSRTPIYLKGFVDGDKVEGTFFEEGALRKSNGTFVWRINKVGGGLSGTFNSTAARSSGRSSAGREL